MRLGAVRNRVIVRPLAREEVTRGGIVIPAAAQDHPQQGEAVAVGPKALEVKVGDTVVFPKHGGIAFDHEGEGLLLFVEPELLAVLE